MQRVFVWLIILLVLIQPTKISADSGIVIKELLVHPSSGNDKITIYNTSNQIIDISGWILVDSTSTMKTLTGSINSGESLISEVGTRLNNSGDTIYLKDSSESIIYSFIYNSDPGIDVPIEVYSITTSPTTPPTPSPSPQTTPTPSPTPSSTPSPATITISNTPQSTDVNSQFMVTVNISNFPANKQIYLKGAFRKAGSSNYFGQTEVSGNWIKNYETYSKQLPVTTDSIGNWSGNVSIKGDSNDSGFSGEGDYLFKVGYYLDPSVLWSNETTLHLTGSVAVEEANSSQTDSKVVSVNSTSTTNNLISSRTQVKEEESTDFSYPDLNDILGTTSASLSGQLNLQPDILIDNLKVKTVVSPFSMILIILGISLLVGGGILGIWRFIPQNQFHKPKKLLKTWQKDLRTKVESLRFGEKWEQVKQLLPKGLQKD